MVCQHKRLQPTRQQKQGKDKGKATAALQGKAMARQGMQDNGNMRRWRGNPRHATTCDTISHSAAANLPSGCDWKSSHHIIWIKFIC